jgi:hypothetical protein
VPGRLLVVVVLASACATPMPAHVAARVELERFSSSLARVGMSVGVPPRICDEPGPLSFDDDVGCVQVSAEGDDAVRVYAYRAGDEALLSTLALAVEAEFDALRKSKAGAKDARPKKKRERPARKPDLADAGVVDAGAVDAGGADVAAEPADAGAAVPTRARRRRCTTGSSGRGRTPRGRW